MDPQDAPALGPVLSATHANEIQRMEQLGYALSNIEKTRVAGQLTPSKETEFRQFLGEHQRLRHAISVYPLHGAGVTG